jgi:hypothetical protein
MSGPWDTEPDTLDFEAEGLPCAMRRNHHRVWCGYVGIGPEHPLFGLPTNHPLKLPPVWFKGRRGLEGTGPIDFFVHAMLSDGQPINEACPIAIALQVHGGVNFADDSLPQDEPDGGRWWFGFDCSHAGDYLPTINDKLGRMVARMPEHMRNEMRRTIERAVYRDQQYVVGECQSLAAQLVAIVAVIGEVRDTAQRG